MHEGLGRTIDWEESYRNKREARRSDHKVAFLARSEEEGNEVACQEHWGGDIRADFFEDLGVARRGGIVKFEGILDAAVDPDCVDVWEGLGEMLNVGGKAGEVGVVHDVCFDTLHLGLELVEAFLTTACDNDLLTHAVEALGKGFSNARGAADDQDCADR